MNRILLIEARKDTFYRLKNNLSICWRLVLWLFATKFRKIAEEYGEQADCVKCIVFDDTLLAKTGQCIEKASRVWDLITGRFILGFKMLLMDSWFKCEAPSHTARSANCLAEQRDAGN